MQGRQVLSTRTSDLTVNVVSLTAHPIFDDNYLT